MWIWPGEPFYKVEFSIKTVLFQNSAPIWGKKKKKSKQQKKFNYIVQCTSE